MRQTVLLACLATALLGSAAQAETLIMDKVRADNQAGAVLPARGMSMAAVSARFGEPRERFSAVGEPPISRWVYGDYVVYFERDRVLHTVVAR